jgi:hypothetical protein
MFTVLVSAEICQDPAFAFFHLNSFGNLANNVQHGQNKRVVILVSISEGRNMLLWHHDDVQRPKRFRVVICEDLIVLILNLEVNAFGDSDIAIEIIAVIFAHGVTSIRSTPFGCVSPFQIALA